MAISFNLIDSDEGPSAAPMKGRVAWQSSGTWANAATIGPGSPPA
jgi:hypothetical protein